MTFMIPIPPTNNEIPATRSGNGQCEFLGRHVYQQRLNQGHTARACGYRKPLPATGSCALMRRRTPFCARSRQRFHGAGPLSAAQLRRNALRRSQFLVPVPPGSRLARARTRSVALLRANPPKDDVRVAGDLIALARVLSDSITGAVSPSPDTLRWEVVPIDESALRAWSGACRRKRRSDRRAAR